MAIEPIVVSSQDEVEEFLAEPIVLARAKSEEIPITDELELVKEPSIEKALPDESSMNIPTDSISEEEKSIVEQVDSIPENSISEESELLDSRGAVLSGIYLETINSECSQEPCDLYYVFNATLENNTSKNLDTIDLAVGIFWQNENQVAIFPRSEEALTDNEELVSLQSLSIVPFGKKQLKIEIDRAIPIVPGGSFVPNLRILSSNNLNVAK